MLLVLAAPILGLKTGMPSIKVLPEDASARVGYEQVKEAFGPGAPGMLQSMIVLLYGWTRGRAAQALGQVEAPPPTQAAPR